MSDHLSDHLTLYHILTQRKTQTMPHANTLFTSTHSSCSKCWTCPDCGARYCTSVAEDYSHLCGQDDLVEPSDTLDDESTITITLDKAAAANDDHCWFLTQDGLPLGWVLDIEGADLDDAALIDQLHSEMSSHVECAVEVVR